MDINYWYVEHKGICPNCGADMNKFHPAMNIYPHFTGTCVAVSPVCENPELRVASVSRKNVAK